MSDPAPASSSPAPARNPGPTPQLAKAKDHPGQVKETLVSLIIAFVMAFVFRAFVAEAFIIPTGSMAPTLLGQHSRHQSPETGYNWPVNPPQNAPANAPDYGVNVEDPMTRQDLTQRVKRRAGDRILVFKYLYQIYDPKRWDVVVFKAPHDPQTNYIKRLIALPSEEPALIDGDVFIREPKPGEPAPAAGAANTWRLPGWQIKRKPERVQRTVWQDVFWSQYQPLHPVIGFNIPWVGGQGWEIEGRQSYTYSGRGPTRLEWNNGIRPIVDYYAYDQTANTLPFPVSDVNMSAGVEPAPGTTDLPVSAVIRTRGHEFRADIGGGGGTTVTLRMGELEPPGPVGEAQVSQWTTLATGELTEPIAPGRITNLEFWHVDQSLLLWANGELIASGTYDWTPAERIERSTKTTLEQIEQQAIRLGGNPLSTPSNYDQPRVHWEFGAGGSAGGGATGGFTLHRVGLQRDLFYQPADRRDARPARATHPAASLVLGPDHFFVVGDNSPLSLDARLWGDNETWVAEQIDAADGVVPRDLLIGRAFFVYFPSLTPGGLGIPVPDFGRMRWIW